MLAKVYRAEGESFELGPSYLQIQKLRFNSNMRK